ncbi:MAG TPA: SAM-dependent methyltransferase [Polyangiaceae bacterium]|nr:SAM-dependent methyltransferase [Polyangiaceae bacterium]
MDDRSANEHGRDEAGRNEPGCDQPGCEQPGSDQPGRGPRPAEAHCSKPTAELAPHRGALVVVGTGIQWAAQTTLAARRAIEAADCVLFALADPWGARWVRSLNPRAESFVYASDGGRREIYSRMVEDVLMALTRHQRVCAAFYGSPAILTQPAHDAIHRARAAGHRALMLPGVSSLDCLFADLAVDPGQGGLQFYEASEFLARPRQLDLGAHLVLGQIALVGERGVYDPRDEARLRAGLRRLAARLLQDYPPAHQVLLYEASQHPALEPRILAVPLRDLYAIDVSEISSLYIPPIPREGDGLSRVKFEVFNSTQPGREAHV